MDRMSKSPRGMPDRALISKLAPKTREIMGYPVSEADVLDHKLNVTDEYDRTRKRLQRMMRGIETARAHDPASVIKLEEFQVILRLYNDAYNALKKILPAPSKALIGVEVDHNKIKARARQTLVQFELRN